MLFDILSPYSLDDLVPHATKTDQISPPEPPISPINEETEGSSQCLETQNQPSELNYCLPRRDSAQDLQATTETGINSSANAITDEAFNHAMVDAKDSTKPLSGVPADADAVPGQKIPPEKPRIDSGVSEYLSKLIHLTLDDPVKIISTRILDTIQSYGMNEHTHHQGFATLYFPIVADHVKNKTSVKLVLPAFPAKSPNRVDKVLGHLPDLGEELALAHLDGMCQAIAEFYAPGAEVYVASDGIVYSDILHVTDEDVWDYGEALRALAEEKGLHRIKFVRVWDLLDHEDPKMEGQGDRLHYLTHAACIRRELALRYGDRAYNPSEAIKNDPDTLATYMGYKKFLAGDLAREVWVAAASGKEKKALFAEVAKEMLVRGRMYANAIKENMSDCVRLSIHPSQDRTKLSISLLPQARGNLEYTPWHSCVAVELDGTYRTAHAADFRDAYDLIYLNGRPHHFRARSHLFVWDVDVQFEFLYPCGLIIRPSPSSTKKKRPCACKIPMQKIRALSNTFSPVICKGFRPITDEEAFIEQAEQMGELLPWFFGTVEKVRDDGRDNTVGNPAKSNEALPMHFDGTFKMVDQMNSETGLMEKVQQIPTYQFFTCRATAPKGSGATLFMNSRLFWRHLAAPYSIERLEGRKWDIYSSGYWEKTITDLQLVVKHPVTGAPCLRWNENWSEEKTMFSSMRSCIQPDVGGKDKPNKQGKEGGKEPYDGEEGLSALERVLEKTMYDRRVTLWLEWEKGDLLVNDNVAMLHTRTGYEGGCAREIWRIHVD